MAKSRPGPSPQKIIDEPKLKSPVRQMTEGSITTFLWVFWIYFIFPALTSLLWLLGFRYSYEALFPSRGLSQLIIILKNSGLFIFVILAINIAWIYYNYHFIYKRFGERRKRTLPPKDSAIASFLVNDAEYLKEARKHKRLNFTLKGNRFFINIPPEEYPSETHKK